MNEPASAAGGTPDPASGDGPDPMAAMRQRGFLALLLLAAIVGVIASAAAFGFLELAHELQPWIYNDLPDALGFDSRPDWWALPVLAIAGLLAAVAIVKLPGIGGHIPANGLNPAPTEPIELPGVLCAALASIGFGVVLGPEAPLIAMGGAIGFLVIRLIRRDAPPEVQQVLAAVVGIVASAAAFAFLELDHELKPWIYNDLPDALGFDTRPDWWPLPVLAIAGLLAALAIVRLPGTGGHIPANGLNPAPTQPIELPGVLLAALASIGFGIVLGPEAPLIAMGGAIGFLIIRLLRRDAPDEVQQVIAACGTFAAVSFLFGSPVIAAVLMIEAAGIGGGRLNLILVPGLLAAGIGALVSIGLGSWTGVDTSDIAIGTVTLPDFARPDLLDFVWTIPLAALIALGVFVDLHDRPPDRSDRDRAPVHRPADDRARHRGARDPLLADHGPWDRQRAVLGPGDHLAPGRPRQLLDHRGPRGADRLQGPRLRPRARELPRRPGVPSPPAGDGGRPAGRRAAGLRDDPSGRGRDRRRNRRRPAAAVDGGRARHLLTARPAVGAAPLVIVGVVVAYMVTSKLPSPAPAEPQPAT